MAPAEDYVARFLAAAADPSRPRIAASDIAVVVAHPDDETIGSGALLARLDGVRLLLVTDGAARDRAELAGEDLEMPALHASARVAELEKALTLAGIPTTALTRFGVPDQEAALDLAGLTRRIAGWLAEHGIRIVLTHAFEGGHPDHDAAAFAVHGARQLLARRGGGPDIVEMPYYRNEGSGEVNQAFEHWPGLTETVLTLTAHEQALKRGMLGAHASQATTLARFQVDAERFRRAPAYDFERLPNGGSVLYDKKGWEITGVRWLDLCRAACTALGLTPCPRRGK